MQSFTVEFFQFKIESQEASVIVYKKAALSTEIFPESSLYRG